MKKGFSLVELLIVLAVIASIMAVSTPLALNAMRKARATAVASDFKTLSRAISSSMYLGDGIPSSIDSLGRNVSSDYGVAWSDNEGVYDFVIFTNKEVDTSTLYTLLTNTGAGFPAGEYEFFPGGAANSDNSKAYYHVYLDGSGNQTVSAGKSFVFSSFNDLSFFNAFKSYGQGNWQTTGSGLSGSGLSGSEGKIDRNRGILDTDENWSDYEINVDLFYTDKSGSGTRGYKIIFRAQIKNPGDPAHQLNGYYLDFAPIRPILALQSGNSNVDGAEIHLSDLGGKNWLETLNNTSHSLKIIVKGNQFDVYFNGTHAFTANHETFKTGRIGLETYGNVEVVFKNVTVKPL